MAEAALADTLDAVAACGATRKVLALDGPPGPWLPPGFEVIPQRGRRLQRAAGQRLGRRRRPRPPDRHGHPAGDGRRAGRTPGPARRRPRPRRGEAPLRRAVLGHALDGGWWVIGWRPADPRSVFAGIPMSAPTTGLAQETRLRASGFDVLRAEPKRDIDDVARPRGRRRRLPPSAHRGSWLDTSPSARARWTGA